MLLSEITVDPPGGQARLPLTREEIAQAVDGFRVYWTLRTGDVEASAFLEMLLASNSLRFCACACAFADDVAGCMRELRLAPLRYRPRPRPRARRSRQGHGGSRRERGPPGSDDDGGGDPPSRSAAPRIGARP
jgi:hypothetical protein